MRILTYSCYFTPEIAASMYLTEDILEGMAKAGHTIDLFVPMPCRGIDDNLRREYKKKKKETFFDEKLVVHRFSMPKESKNSILRALRYFWLNMVFLFKGLNIKYDVLFAQSTPPTQGLMCAILKHFKRKPFVYNLQDIFPDSLVNTGMTKQGSLIWKIGRIIENCTYRNADQIIVISEDFKNNLMGKGVSEKKIKVVPNWADTKSVYCVNREDNVLFDKYKLDRDKFYISYSGNIGFTQNMDLLIDVAKEIRIEYPNVCFALIGDGVAKENVAKRIKSENIDNIVMLPFQPYEHIAYVFSLGDAGLIISKSGVGNNSVPSKTWSYMAASKPIIASFDVESELCKLISGIGCGINAMADSKEEMINAIRQVIASDRNCLGQKGLVYIKENLGKEKCVEQYISTLENMKQ